MESNLVKQRIEKLINDNEIILFMKGNKEHPYCGFSARVNSILSNLGVNYETVDVLQDNEIREGVKQYSDWATIPQLYIKQEFIGGCDIVSDMFQSGELRALLISKGIVQD